MSISKLLTNQIKPWCDLFVNSINVETEIEIGNLTVNGDLVVEGATSLDGIVYNTGYRGSFGGISGVPTTQAFAAAAVYQNILATNIPLVNDSIMFNSLNLTTNPSLQYVGGVSIKCSVFSSVWVNTTSSVSINLAVFINGVIIQRSAYTRINMTNVTPTAPLTCFTDGVNINPNDIIEVRIVNSNTNPCRIYGFSLQVTAR